MWESYPVSELPGQPGFPPEWAFFSSGAQRKLGESSYHVGPKKGAGTPQLPYPGENGLAASPKKSDEGGRPKPDVLGSLSWPGKTQTPSDLMSLYLEILISSLLTQTVFVISHT